jgi:hypothetical protein
LIRLDVPEGQECATELARRAAPQPATMAVFPINSDQ